MISRDYTQEVGIPSQKKTLSRPVAIALLAAVAGGITFGVVTVINQSRLHETALNPPASSATAVAPAAPAKP